MNATQRLTATQRFWLNELYLTEREIGWGGFPARTAHSLTAKGLIDGGYGFDSKYRITEKGRKWIDAWDDSHDGGGT